jgi:hypothetical protein
VAQSGDHSVHWRGRKICSRGRGAQRGLCGDPDLPLRDSCYAYNSRSHDQYVVSPHNRADIKVASSITVPNKILTIGHMTKYDSATQGKFTN